MLEIGESIAQYNGVVRALVLLERWQPPLSRCSKVLKGRAQHLVRLMLVHTLHVCLWVCRHIQQELSQGSRHLTTQLLKAQQLPGAVGVRWWDLQVNNTTCVTSRTLAKHRLVSE